MGKIGFVQHFKMLCLKDIQNLYQEFYSISNRKDTRKVQVQDCIQESKKKKNHKNQLMLYVHVSSTPSSENNLRSPKESFPCLCQFSHFQAQKGTILKTFM